MPDGTARLSTHGCLSQVCVPQRGRVDKHLRIYGSPHRKLKPTDGAFLETLGTSKCAIFACCAPAAVAWGFVTFT